MALGASVQVASRAGERTLPVAALYDDDGIHPVRLRAGEVVTGVQVPVGDWRSTYVKYRVRGAFDFPIAAVAAAARFDGDICLDARLVLQGVATLPLRVPDAEALLRGQRWTHERIEAAAEAAYKIAHPMDNASGTIALRRRVVRAYTRQALETVGRGDMGE
jgi:CO/xanthine dehydrogenase FAD-binding subunit